ncbi:hypothetical protein [Fluviicola taffensis]|uniref:Uncharacterized protein n=1 Tax=Fluviicola taffensis (strain DSM 16823 / NCIMB 13979 / RW262) TaxID=755732 RepID=F2IGD1_FLUTR|nr:hypothetical protein [Fluviicola taffensis]AEA45797.1 hypothetical protein Fluta_3831 [Fluviicola taffensis DSM 16823]
MKLELSNKTKGLILIGIILLVVIQFFWVLKVYFVLESTKVFWWMVCYFSVPILLFSLSILKKFTRFIFYSHERSSRREETKWNRFRSKFTSFMLLIFLFSFFTYDTIIQTNDWWGSSETERFNQVIEEVSINMPTGRTRIFQLGKGPTSYDIYMEYQNERIQLNTPHPWNIGDTFQVKMNTGGLWGILYARK